MNLFLFKRAVDAVKAERERQNAKWGGGPGDCCHPATPDRQRLAILAEEFGEVAKAILESDMDGLEDELVQVAAVVMAWLEGLYSAAQ